MSEHGGGQVFISNTLNAHSGPTAACSLRGSGYRGDKVMAYLLIVLVVLGRILV
jgi:hypothetical protein